MNEDKTACRLSVAEQRAIAEQVLGTVIDDRGFTDCPGGDCHSTGNGARDFRLFFEDGKMPREHCFHQSCQSRRDEVMAQIFTAIRRAEQGQGEQPRAWRAPARVKPQPREREGIPQLDRELAESIAKKADGAWTLERLRRYSPVSIPDDAERWPWLLLDSLFTPGQRLLLFTRFTSQGDYLYSSGRGLVKLGRKPGERAQVVELGSFPRRNLVGAWFLCSPVTGKWQSNPNNGGLPGRRHGACCTGHPYAVLESDSLPPETWLKILVQLPERVAAVYTSGGKSIHALLRVDARSHREFMQHRERLLRLAAVGADPAAISAVRLTRLPGVVRSEKSGDNLQRLLYLNPNPTYKPIQERDFC